MLLPPLNLSMAEVSRRKGGAKYLCPTGARRSVPKEAVPEDKPLSESWSAEARLAVVLETAGLSELELGEYCRRKGLTPNTSTPGAKPVSLASRPLRSSKRSTANKRARTRNVSRTLSVSDAAKTRRRPKRPRCGCCGKSSTTTGGPTTRTTDVFAGTAVARGMVDRSHCSRNQKSQCLSGGRSAAQNLAAMDRSRRYRGRCPNDHRTTNAAQCVERGRATSDRGAVQHSRPSPA